MYLFPWSVVILIGENVVRVLMLPDSIFLLNAAKEDTKTYVGHFPVSQLQTPNSVQLNAVKGHCHL